MFEITVHPLVIIEYVHISVAKLIQSDTFEPFIVVQAKIFNRNFSSKGNASEFRFHFRKKKTS